MTDMEAYFDADMEAYFDAALKIINEEMKKTADDDKIRLKSVLQELKKKLYLNTKQLEEERDFIHQEYDDLGYKYEKLKTESMKLKEENEWLKTLLPEPNVDETMFNDMSDDEDCKSVKLKF